MIDGVSYTVRYVDENKTDIATPKTMLGERGSQINERAKTVPGYTYQQAEQSFTLKDGMEIQFVYTLTNPNEVILSLIHIFLPWLYPYWLLLTC